VIGFLYNAAVSYRLFGASSDPRNALAHAGHSHGKTPIRKSPAPVEAPSWALDAVLELNGEWHAKQKVAGEIDDNSGGNTIYIAPGLRASYGRFSSFVSVGIPVVNKMSGLQSRPDYRVLTGMSFAN